MKRSVVVALPLALVAIGCAGGSATGAARGADPAAPATAELEAAFWACDYVATTRGVSATPIAACRHAMESLKREKFGGSYPALLEWWRVNKAAEHLKMERRFD
jgi:hypothetical protein